MSKAYTRARKGDHMISGGKASGVASGKKEPRGNRRYNDGSKHKISTKTQKRGRHYA